MPDLDTNSSSPRKTEEYVKFPLRVLFDDLLPHAACRLYGILVHFSFRQRTPGRCTVGIEDLVARMRGERRTVDRALKTLRDDGYVRVESRGFEASTYHLPPGDPPCVKNDARPCVKNDARPCAIFDADPADRTVHSVKKEEREEGPPPAVRPEPPTLRQADAFEEHDYESLKGTMGFILAERLHLAGMSTWFPDLFARFAVRRGWRRKKEHQTGLEWADDLAAEQVTEAEARTAFDHVRRAPQVDARGNKAPGRSADLDRILDHVRRQRRRPSTARAPAAHDAATSAPRPTSPFAEAELALAQATDAAREQARRRVLAKRPRANVNGGQFLLDWAAELRQPSPAQPADVDASNLSSSKVEPEGTSACSPAAGDAEPPA